MKVLLTAVLLTFSFTSMAGDWSYVSSQLNRLVGNNYIDFTEHNGMVYYATNYNYKKWYSGGKLWLQRSNSITSRPGTPWNPISKSELGQYDDIWGQPMNYVRTIGMESYGGRCYLLLHVGAKYGSSQGYYYAPAFADSENCVDWTYHGPVSIDFVPAPYIFSSSSGYFIEDGVHYMVQDAGSYGDGRLVIYSSVDGINYTQYSDDINLIATDRPVFPDMEACGGQYHMEYENGWGIGGNVMRHIMSDNISDWYMEDATVGTNPKSANISCIDNTLYSISNRRLFRWQP